MKKLIKTITALLITVLLAGSVPAVSAGAYTNANEGVSFTVPESWKKQTVTYFPEINYSDEGLKELQKKQKEKYERFNVVYKTEYSFELSKIFLFGSSPTVVADTGDYLEGLKKTVTSDYSEPKLLLINSKQYILTSSPLNDIYIHVENSRVYQFEFQFTDGIEKPVLSILESVEYSKPKASNALIGFGSDDSENSNGVAAYGKRPLPAYYYLIYFLCIPAAAVLVILFYKAAKKRGEKRRKQYTANTGVNIAGLDKRERTETADLQEEITKRESFEYNSFEETGGYLKLGGSGFNEKPGETALAEAALDTVNGYPQVTFAYYEASPGKDSNIIITSAPLTELSFKRITPENVSGAVKTAAKKLPPHVVIDYGKITDSKDLELWCKIARKLSDTFTYPGM